MQIRTTSSLSSCARRRSAANLSIAQKQMAPMTTIIKTPIKAESIARPPCRDNGRHEQEHSSGPPARERVSRAGNCQIGKSAGLPVLSTEHDQDHRIMESGSYGLLRLTSLGRTGKTNGARAQGPRPDFVAELVGVPGGCQRRCPFQADRA